MSNVVFTQRNAIGLPRSDAKSQFEDSTKLLANVQLDVIEFRHLPKENVVVMQLHFDNCIVSRWAPLNFRRLVCLYTLENIRPVHVVGRSIKLRIECFGHKHIKSGMSCISNELLGNCNYCCEAQSPWFDGNTMLLPYRGFRARFVHRSFSISL